MPFADAAFISITEIDGTENHRAYNEWHHLDHLPENLLLDGVAWGERWVRSPACNAASLVASTPFAEFHYLTLYWFRQPVERSIGQWADLADRSFHWGRRQELPWTTRPYMGFFRPILGYAAPRVEVSPQALPMRPCRGVYLVASDVNTSPEVRPAIERRNRWYDREGIPALLERDGVAGVWTFNAEESLAPPAWAEREQRRGIRDASSTALRLTVMFLDGDPVTVARAMELGHVLAPGARDLEQVRFAGPLESIQPWSYDWFETTDKAEGPRTQA